MMYYLKSFTSYFQNLDLEFILRIGRWLIRHQEQKYLESRTIESGDVILLIKGGHGFEVLEDLEMFEVKQGPYAGDADKIKFTP